MSDQGVIECRDCNGELTINNVSMHTPAWCVLDLAQLWMPNAVRGQNVIIPGAAGQRAYRIRRDQARYSLPMVITGYVDDLGDRYADPWIGFVINLDFLRANVIDPPVAATQVAELIMPDGSLRVENIQVVGFTLADDPAPMKRATLDIVVPSGIFQ